MLANRLSNWSGTIRTAPASIVRPGDIDAVIDAITDDTTHPSPLRAMGSYHSTTGCATADDGTVVDMSALDKILEIGPNFVRAQAGALYIDVAHALRDKGMSFYVDLEIGNATLGSVATCATKDGSYRGEFGQAGCYVSAVKMVSAHGELVEVDEGQPELLAAVRSSYGLLGIVVEVTVLARKLQPIAVRHQNFSLEEFLAALPQLTKRDGSLAMYLFPFADRVTAQLRESATPHARRNRYVWKLRNFGVAVVIPLLSRASRLLVLRPLRNAMIQLYLGLSRFALATFVRAKNTDPTDQITRYKHRPRLTRFTFSIWAFPADAYAATLRDFYLFIRAYDAANGYRPDLLSVGYHVAQSRHSLLSYSWDGPVLTIDPVATGGPRWDRFVDAFNEFCHDHQGQPLLNQSPRLTARLVSAAFGERWQEFKLLREELDPHERFLNPYFRALLG